MAAQPFGYDAQKAILQYMDPNQRIQMSLCCPTIRVLEKSLPLKIDYLLFGGMTTKINGTTYRLGVIRKYHQGRRCPNHNSIINKEGGSREDLDRFGMEDGSEANTVTHGDVDLQRFPREILTAEQLDRRYRRFEVQSQGAERHLRRMRAGGPAPNNEVATPETIASMRDYAVGMRRILQPWYWKRENIDPPFTCLLQLTIRSGEEETIERFQYTKKLHEALKYLNTILLGARHCEVHVNRLTLLEDKWIYRFPIGLKLNIIKSMRSCLVDYNLLNNIIDPSNYSTISLIIIDGDPNADRYNSLAIQQAKTLTIDAIVYNEDSYFEIMRKLENQYVTFLNENISSDYVRLASNWIENGKPIGTFYSFGFRKENTIKRCLKSMKAENAGRVLIDRRRYITFSMPTGSSKLRVYYERILPQPERFDYRDIANSLWNLIFKVELI